MKRKVLIFLFALPFLWFTQAFAAIPRNGLVIEYLFDGNSKDTSWNGYDAAAHLVWWSDSYLIPGRKNASFSHSLVLVPANASTMLKNDFTLSAWVKSERWDGNPYHDGIIYQMGSTRLHYGYATYTDWGNTWEVRDPNVPSDDLYHLYVFTKSSVSWMKLYRDGVLVDSNSINTDAEEWAGTYIWYSGPPWHWRFDGYMQSVRLYNRAISNEEVQGLYGEILPVNTSETLPSPTFTGSYLSARAGSIFEIKNGSSDLIAWRFLKGLYSAKKIDNINAWDPIDLSSGEFTYANTFLVVPGVKLPYEFSLTYRNQMPYDGPVGHNFDHNYNVFLHENEDGSVTFYNGKLWIFDFPVSGGSYVRNAGLRATLWTEAQSWHYFLAFDEGSRYEFWTNLKASGYSDRYGNSLSFEYSPNGSLSVVTDTLGRAAHYEYGDDTRLVSVTDLNGRKVELAYYPVWDSGGVWGDLKSVTIRSGAESRSVSFAYTAVGHWITGLVDSKGQTYVRNTYDSEWRVISQDYGSGTLNYSYALSGSLVSANIVTNAEGVATKYSYDANGNVTERRISDSTWTWATVYRYEYNQDARLTKETLPNGNGTTYRYDTKGNVTEVRRKTDANATDSPSDLVTTYEYDDVYGIPVKTTDPNGFVKTSALDGSGNLVSETSSGILNVDGTTYSSTKSYEYDTRGRLVRSILPNGLATVLAYSGSDVVSSTRGSGSATIIRTSSYDPYGNPVTDTDGEGGVKTVEYDGFGRVLKTKSPMDIEVHYAYDANGNEISEETRTSTGLLTAGAYYEYDVLDRATKKTERISATESRTTVTAYDKNGNAVSIREGSGAETRLSYDEMARVKEKRIVSDPSDSTKDVITAYSYDRNGNLLIETDPLGRTTSYTYDSFDRKATMLRTGAKPQTYSYDRAGNLTDVKLVSWMPTPMLPNPPVIEQTTVLYDGVGRPIRTTKSGLSNPSVPAVSTTVRYNPNGNIVSSTDAMGYSTSYQYDSFGRLTRTVDPVGNSEEVAYDKRSLPTSRVLSWNGSAPRETRTAYDADGRVTVQSAATSTGTLDTVFAYGSTDKPVSITDADGNRTDYSYDSLARMVSRTEYLADGTPVVTAYEYDALGHVVSVTDPDGKTTQYAYDPLWNNVRVTYPDGSHKDVIYGKTGKPVTETSARWISVTTVYDSLDRPSSLSVAWTWVVGTTSESYGYDDVGRLATATSNGTFLASTGTSSQSSSVSFAYDGLGRMSAETQNGKQVSYSYDKNGNVLSATVVGKPASWGKPAIPDRPATYSRDGLGRLTSAAFDWKKVVSRTYSWLFLSDDLFTDGVSTSYSYDSVSRLSGLSRPGFASISRNYSYSPANKVLSDGAWLYSFDTLSRLVSAEPLSGSIRPSGAESYAYGIAGNRLASAFSGTSATYSANALDQYSNVVRTGTSSGTQSFSYDADGNLTNDGKFTYSYDFRSRIVAVRKIDGTFVAGYAYDPLWRRVLKSTQDGWTTYLYARDNVILDAFAANWSSLTRSTFYLYGDSPDELLAYAVDETLPKSTAVRKTYAVRLDRLGSPVAIVESANSVSLEYGYSTYGEAYSRTGNGAWVPMKVSGIVKWNTRLFTGREYDAETGLYYYRARTYSPELGRFLQRDPVWQADQVNPYAYVANNPLGYTDPTGREKKFIASHDATQLVAAYAAKGRIGIINSSTPKLTYARMSFDEFNIKYNKEFIDLSYNDPGLGNERTVYVRWERVTLSQLWNFFIGFNWYSAGFSLNSPSSSTFSDIYQSGMFTEQYIKDRGALGAISNETGDEPWYDAGYACANSLYGAWIWSDSSDIKSVLHSTQYSYGVK